MKNVASKEDNKYGELLEQIQKRIDDGATKAAKAVLKHQLETYWDTGRYIVEYEQDGLAHAEYGLELLKRLAKDLTLSNGKGFGRSNLYAMRKFYQLYPDGYNEIKDLTWSHICELINIWDILQRR